MAETFEEMALRLGATYGNSASETIYFARAVAKWQASRDAEICNHLLDKEMEAAANGTQDQLEPRYHDCIECSHAILKAAEEM